MSTACIIYICDPEKNTGCTKEGCQVYHCCCCTIEPEFAKTDKNGDPIVYDTYVKE